MALIKNVKDLTQEELESFEKLYREYFRNACVRSNPKHPRWSRINDWLMARKHVEIMMREIKAGFKTAFVAFDFSEEKETVRAVISGLIVGYCTDSGMANISHLYVKPEIDHYPRELFLRELYRTFALYVKEDGMDRIQTSSDILSPSLSEDLESLEFERVGTNGTEIYYAKSLTLEQNVQSSN